MTSQQKFRASSFVAGLNMKAPIHTVSEINIDDLSGVGDTIGGYVVGAGDRVLLIAQTSPIDNGIYTVESTAWFRSGDCDGNRDLVGGTLFPVWDEATLSGRMYILDGDPTAKIINTDSLTFSLYYLPNNPTLASDRIIVAIADRTGILTDAGNTVVFEGAVAAQTMTIPAASSVAHELGTFLAWDNNGSEDIDIAITDDELVLADDGSTGTRTLAPDGFAVAQLIAAAKWKIAGKQLT